MIRRTGRIGVLAVAVALTAGCGGSGGNDDEQAFLDRAYAIAADNGAGLRGYGDDAVLKLGREACRRIADGDAPAEVARDWQGQDMRGVSSVAGGIVGAAEIHLCPEGEGGGLGDAFREGFERGASE